jgi:hypothetical protein
MPGAPGWRADERFPASPGCFERPDAEAAVMTGEKKAIAPNPSSDDRATAAPKITRRRFAKAGVAAPLIMTLGSRPVWGQCLTLSGIQSGNTSDADDPERHLAHGTEGYPASYWICHPSSDWLVGQTYAICTTQEASTSSTVIIYQPNDLWLGLNGDEYDKEVAAAILNATLLDGFGYSVDEIRGFIASIEDDADLIAFLRCLNGRTQPVPPCPNTTSGNWTVKLTEGETTTCFTVDSSVVFYSVDGVIFGVGEVSELECPPECIPPPPSEAIVD